ncbi:general odorant-binding protein 71 [Drosophila erecta]|uniref:Odorant-binding protein 59a, isoform A n=1 Tax=Drosophila erecta TaxID=7220 RepID=B3NNU5_DROER|nr:general odorant-binding protein 71 [Drosophila erecta]EDV56678.1 Odorant-binding protein 59a, isoform A [Drosophila erecta]
MNLILLLIGLSCGICSIYALKCRSQEGLGEAELKRTVRSCMHRQDDDEDRGRGGQGRQGKGYEYGYGMDQDEEQDRNPGSRGGYGNRRQRGLRQSDGRNHTSSDGGQCVAQCFFEQMNMVDGNGMPDRRKVSYMLTKDLRDRELRNFYTDTVQQCFRYLESNGRGRHHKCAVARELVKCMSEYAKAQCEDWEEHGNMLFN